MQVWSLFPLLTGPFAAVYFCELEHLQHMFTFKDVRVLLGVIERWELLKARSRCSERDSSEEPQQLRCDLDNITSWLKNVIPELDRLQEPDPAACIEEMEARAKELKVRFNTKHKKEEFVLIIKKSKNKKMDDCFFFFFFLQEMQKVFTHYKSIMLSVNLRSEEAPEAQERLTSMNRDWSRACTGLQQWDLSLRKKLMQCQVRGNTTTDY